MLPIEWRADARDDLAKIIGFIAQNNPAAARRMKELIDAATIPLAEHPHAFRRSERVSCTREVVAHPNYFCIRPGLTRRDPNANPKAINTSDTASTRLLPKVIYGVRPVMP